MKDVARALVDVGYDKTISFEPLVRSGGTVALQGGHVWREMLPNDATDDDLDRMATEALGFMKGLIEEAREQ